MSINKSRSFSIDIPREAYKDLEEWKNKSDLVMMVEGARQVGKTYLVTKFAKENFKRVIYINLFEDSGARLVNLLDTLGGIGDERKFLLKVLKEYDNSFEDTEDTIVIVDEIQESYKVYNKIRSFNRYMNCRFIVTGSYLGRTVLDRKFWISAGDYDSLTITPLSFREFLGAIDKNSVDLFDTIDLYGNSPKEDYDVLRNIFNIYLKIGGYPIIVKNFLQYNDLTNLGILQDKLLQTFSSESAFYLGDEKYINMINKSFKYFASLLLREKKGLQNNNVSEEIIKLKKELKYKVGTLGFTKSQYSDVLNWLLATHTLYSCDKCVNCDLLDIEFNQRFYFNDTGILFNLLASLINDLGTVNGTLNENYVCQVLKRKNLMINFATFDNYELDFLLKDFNYIYGIEVKSGKSQGKSVKKALQKGLINKILYLKGDTYGGIEGDIITVPIYLFERYEFNTSRDIFYKELYDSIKFLKEK